MKKLFLFFALVLTICSTAMAQVLNEETAVGTIGTLDGREAMVVDLGGSIGKVAIATKNVGAVGEVEKDYGSHFTPADANDADKNGLADGWYVPSKKELDALTSHLTQYNAYHCVKWEVTKTATLYLPCRLVSGGYKGEYVSSKRTKWSDHWTCYLYKFTMDNQSNFSYGIDNYEESEYSDCAIRPFHKLPTVEECRTIWYTSSNGEKVTPPNPNAFGDANIVSNEYDEEKGMFRITFDGDVESIGSWAFWNYSSLKSIMLPSGLKSIGEYAFSMCSSLTTINLPSGLKSIGGGAFDECNSLTTINLPNGVTSIGVVAFHHCIQLTSINIPSGVKSIERSTFSDCSNLVSINLPNGITSIGEMAFYNCNSLTDIVLPNDLNYIGQLAFSGCSGLTFITLPAKLTEMGRCPFEGCTNLEYARFLGTTPPSYPEQTIPTLPTYPFTNCRTDIGGTILFVPDDAVDSYEAAGYTNVYPIIIDEFKSTVLAEIETAMNGVTLTDKDAAIVTACLANIESTNDISIIIIEKQKALPIIYLQKEREAAIAEIDAVLDGVTSLLTQEDMDAIEECKRNIAEALDTDVLTKEKEKAAAIILSILKVSAKNDLQSYYVNPQKDDLQTYFNRIDNAGSWAEIENIIQEAINTLDKTFHFVIGDKRYFVTKKEDYEYHHMADYTGGNIYFQDGVRYESNSKNSIIQGEIEYTRTLPEGVWQCWYEPFDVKIDTEKFDAAEVAGILSNAQGETVVAFNKMEKGDMMQANTIYVIRAKEGKGKLTIKPYRPTLYQSTENQLTIQSAYDNYTLTGNYSPVEHGDWYTLDGTGKFSKMSSGSLKPQRFYLTITPRKDQHYVEEHYNAKAFIDMMVMGDEDVTGIQEASPKSSPEGKDLIYNLQGQKVTHIQKGQVYIMGGKKYIAK